MPRAGAVGFRSAAGCDANSTRLAAQLDVQGYTAAQLTPQLQAQLLAALAYQLARCAPMSSLAACSAPTGRR